VLGRQLSQARSKPDPVDRVRTARCALCRCAYDVHNYDVQQHRAGQIISPLSFQTSPASHVTIQNQSTNGRYNRVMKTLPDRSSGSHHRLCFRSGTCHHARCSSGAHHTAFHCYPMETTYTHKHTHTHLGLPGQPEFLVTSVIPGR